MTPVAARTAEGWAGQMASRTARAAVVLRPLSDPRAVRRGAPFAGVALVAVVVELATAPSSSSVPFLAAAGATMTVLLLAALLVPWARLPAWYQALIPLAFFVVVALLRHARGGASSGYPPLLMLPIIWMAVYGNRAHLRVAMVALAATLLGPLVLVGPPLYPSSAWGVSLLSLAVGVLGGPVMHRLVEQSRQRTADVAALGAITRALTAGSDPRPELCAAAALVTGAGFAVLFEPGPDGGLVATAGTPGLDLAQMCIDTRLEASATAEVWRSGTRLYVSDPVGDPRASTRLSLLTGAEGVLFEPVLRDGHPMAVLVVGFTRSRPRVPDAALDMVELVAAELAAALDRANLLMMLAAQARTDPLTGAANRRSWDEALDRELARAERTGEPLTVAVLDMDHFKAFNDTYGHTAGDGLLRELVPALRAELRTGDVIARWGGEEFALALPACDLAEAHTLAARLLGVIPGGQTASIGLALAEPGESPRSLVGRADRALYAAKGAGRNQVKALPASLPSPRGRPAGAERLSVP